MADKIGALVDTFIAEHQLADITYRTLTAAIERDGYTVVEFNGVDDPQPVQRLLRALRLPPNALRSRGFTYADSCYRIIFVHQDLSDSEKKLVLAHEIGHVVCGHMGTGTVIGNDVRQESDAAAFAQRLCADNTQKTARRKAFLRAHKKAVCLSLALVLLLAVGTGAALSVAKINSYYGRYYVTESGSKYHLADCRYVKTKTNAHRLTKTEYESGEYTPCSVCLPGEAETDKE